MTKGECCPQHSAENCDKLSSSEISVGDVDIVYRAVIVLLCPRYGASHQHQAYQNCDYLFHNKDYFSFILFPANSIATMSAMPIRHQRMAGPRSGRCPIWSGIFVLAQGQTLTREPRTKPVSTSIV